MKPKWCVSYKNEIDLFKKCVGFWDENNIPRFSGFMVALSKQVDVPYRKVIHLYATRSRQRKTVYGTV